MKIRITKLFGTIFAAGLFLTGCSTDQTQQTANAEPYQNDPALMQADLDDYWAKDNLDLQRVGVLLERSNSPQEFEGYLNTPDGINNLDLNGDGYVDYISVDEFEDRGPDQRGLSLYTRFGPDAVQEVGTVYFYRDDVNAPGARILLTGNEQIYGDNFYHETNWLDRTLGIVSLLFSDRDEYYRSPYYYDNYPSDYVVYEVVETPIYRTRVVQLYPDPVFVFAAAPTFISKIKIKSPNNGLHLGQIRAKLVKPTKVQAEFIKNNPGRPRFTKGDKGRNPGGPPSSDKQPKGDPGGKGGKPDVNPGKSRNDGKAKGQDQGKGKGKKP